MFSNTLPRVDIDPATDITQIAIDTVACTTVSILEDGEYPAAGLLLDLNNGKGRDYTLTVYTSPTPVKVQGGHYDLDSVVLAASYIAAGSGYTEAHSVEAIQLEPDGTIQLTLTRR